MQEQFLMMKKEIVIVFFSLMPFSLNKPGFQEFICLRNSCIPYDDARHIKSKFYI